MLRALPPPVRFAIIGEAALDKPEWGAHPHVWVLHTWGVNLESPGTPDFAALVDADHGALRRAAYAAAVGEVLGLVFGGALSRPRARAGPAGGRVHVRLPALGLGQCVARCAYASMRFPCGPGRHHATQTQARMRRVTERICISRMGRPCEPVCVT